MNKVHAEHIQVLKTLHENGLITRHAMQSIRGQILAMPTWHQREEYLKKLIKRSARQSRPVTVGHD